MATWASAHRRINLNGQAGIITVPIMSLGWSNRPILDETSTCQIFISVGGLGEDGHVSLVSIPSGDADEGFGSAGTQVHITNPDGDNQNFIVGGASGSSSGFLQGGLWSYDIGCIIAYDPEAYPNAYIDINGEIGGAEGGPFMPPVDLTLNPPTNPDYGPIIYDPNTYQFTFNLTWDNGEELPVLITTEPSPSGFEYVEGWVPYPEEEFEEVFLNEEPPVDTWIFHFRHWTNTPTRRISEPVDLVVEIPTPTVNINAIGAGGVALGGTSTVVFVGDPSGIYTLQEGKTHDTIINRVGATTEELDLPIPKPFIRTGPF